MNYREKAVRIGKTQPLLGILTEPPANVAPNGRGVVLLNAGLLHRVGPSRLHVQVARALAPLGYQVLRFDFSGIGDSEARRDGLAFEHSAVLEVQAAMDYLAETRKVRDFALWGLCSGADAAFLSAVADARVSAVVQLDPWIYHTWKYGARRWARRLLDKRLWRKVFSREGLERLVLRPLHLSKAAAGDESIGENVVVSHYSREFPPKAQVEAQLRTLLDRGVRMLCVFSGGMPEHISYGAQYRECFGAIDMRERVEVIYDASAEHIFSALHHQRLVVDATRHWMAKIHAAARPAAASPASAGALPPAQAQGL